MIEEHPNFVSHSIKWIKWNEEDCVEIAFPTGNAFWVGGHATTHSRVVLQENIKSLEQDWLWAEYIGMKEISKIRPCDGQQQFIVSREELLK